MEEMAEYSSAMGYFEHGQWTPVHFSCALSAKAMMNCRADLFLASFRGDGRSGTTDIYLVLQWSAN